MSVGNSRISLAVFASVLAAAALAQADTVQLSFNGVSPGSSVSYSVNGTSHYNVTAGAMNFTVNSSNYNNSTGNNPFTPGQTISTFCIDATHGLANPDTYTLNYAPNFINSDNSNVLTHFWATYIGSVVNNVTAAAFQTAIWEIIYDHDGNPYTFNSSNNLTNGVFTLNSGSVFTQANSWLSGNFMNTDVTHWHLVELDANTPTWGGQSQLYGYKDNNPNLPPVPTPAALPVGLAMMGGLVAMRKMRRKA